MNHHELLDMIGEVNETYVLAADQPVKRVRSRWQTWAACAACAALMIGAYPAYRALQPKQPPLHSYTVVEDGLGRPTENSGSEKLPNSGSGDVPMGPDGSNYTESHQGPMDPDGAQNEPERIPYQQKAMAQYDNLMRNAGISGDREVGYPAWYGGAWLDNDWPDNISRLTVAIVDGFRTPEMEAQILEWCGGTGDVLFTSAKYSYAHLIQLGDEIWESGLRDSIPGGFGYGPDVMANCLCMDVYDGAISEDALAVLAKLDPDGDAIRVEVHAGQTINTDLVKGPAPGGAQDDQPADAPDEAADTPESAMPAATENCLPQAKYDLLPLPDGENG